MDKTMWKVIIILKIKVFFEYLYYVHIYYAYTQILFCIIYVCKFFVQKIRNKTQLTNFEWIRGAVIKGPTNTNEILEKK